jgi:hypothetical protein
MAVGFALKTYFLGFWFRNLIQFYEASPHWNFSEAGYHQIGIDYYCGQFLPFEFVKGLFG